MVRRRAEPRTRFTVEEANASLPLVRAIVRDLVAIAGDVDGRRRRLTLLMEGREFEPSDPYDAELVHMAKQLEKDSRQVQTYVQELRDLGVEPTSGIEGIVDFPAVVDGREIRLCWKLGEPEVRYWHELDAGFRGRQPLTKLRRPVGHGAAE